MPHKVIIPCGAKKAPSPRRASEFYQGSYHKQCLAWARSNFDDSEIAILSAKYGFIDLGQMLQPYEATFGKRPTERELALLRETASQVGFVERPWVVGGKRYMLATKSVISGSRWLTPFMGLRRAGLGYQIQWLKNNRGYLPS